VLLAHVSMSNDRPAVSVAGAHAAAQRQAAGSGQIIEAIREPWGRGVPGDPEIRFGVGLGRHMVADTCLVYAAAQTIATDRHMDMTEALKVLDVAIDDMAAGRPVSSWRRCRGHVAGRHCGRHDCGVPAHGRDRGAQGFSSRDRRHGSRRTKIH
jgi:hypothetical protein